MSTINKLIKTKPDNFSLLLLVSKLEETLDQFKKHFVPAFGGADRFRDRDRFFHCYLGLGLALVGGNLQIIGPRVLGDALENHQAGIVLGLEMVYCSHHLDNSDYRMNIELE